MRRVSLEGASSAATRRDAYRGAIPQLPGEASGFAAGADNHHGPRSRAVTNIMDGLRAKTDGRYPARTAATPRIIANIAKGGFRLTCASRPFTGHGRNTIWGGSQLCDNGRVRRPDLSSVTDL